MCAPKKCYDFNYAVITLIIMSHKCLSSTTPTTTLSTPEQTCGTVHTSTGKTVTLQQGVPLTPDLFNDIRNMTLNKSLFSPSHGCAIQVCGFMSWGTVKEEGYVGSTSDYADCMEFTHEKFGDDVFYEPFYMSSIACGCKTPKSKCTSACTDTRTKTWNTTDCAITYQERNCNECYFPHTRLSANQNYTTDNTHHVMSLAVRPDCRVLQYSPGMKKVYWFKDTVQPLVYEYNVEQYDVVSSSFMGDGEGFTCECGVKPVSKPPGVSDVGKHGGWGVGLASGVGVLVAVVLVGGYVLRGKVILTRLRVLVSDLRRGSETEIVQNIQSTSTTTIETRTSIDQVSTATLNDHNLEEKLDDVKRLLELLCGCTTIPTPKHLQNEQAVANVTEQFKTVCDPENVLPRDAILYSEHDCLGTGQFGTVYKGVVIHNDGLKEHVAVKKITWGVCTDDHVKSFLREVRTFRDVGGGCEFIVKFVGGCVCTDGLFVLSQFCDGGSLGEYLGGLRGEEGVKGVGGGYTVTTVAVQQRQDVVPQLVSFSYQIACGMEWLSGKGVVHGDVAVRNVLLCSGNVRICDFGLSRNCCGGEYVFGSLSKFPYNSLTPEICKCDQNVYKLSSSVDVWAYGCTLYEMFTLGESVYSHVKAEGPEKVVEVMRLLVNGFRHQRPGIMGGDVYEVVMECWNEEPDDRPSFNELKLFFRGKCS